MNIGYIEGMIIIKMICHILILITVDIIDIFSTKSGIEMEFKEQCLIHVGQ